MSDSTFEDIFNGRAQSMDKGENQIRPLATGEIGEGEDAEQFALVLSGTGLIVRFERSGEVRMEWAELVAEARYRAKRGG